MLHGLERLGRGRGRLQTRVHPVSCGIAQKVLYLRELHQPTPAPNLDQALKAGCLTCLPARRSLLPFQPTHSLAFPSTLNPVLRRFPGAPRVQDAALDGPLVSASPAQSPQAPSSPNATQPCLRFSFAQPIANVPGFPLAPPPANVLGSPPSSQAGLAAPALPIVSIPARSGKFPRSWWRGVVSRSQQRARARLGTCARRGVGKASSRDGAHLPGAGDQASPASAPSRATPCVPAALGGERASAQGKRKRLRVSPRVAQPCATPAPTASRWRNPPMGLAKANNESLSPQILT